MKSALTYCLVALCVMFAFTVSASAQHADQASVREVTTTGNGIGVKPATSALSLLDASRISWSHSYSVAFFSGGGTSGSVGLIRSTMFYDITDNLKLSLNLGMTHNPGALFGSNEQHNAGFLPGFQLDWRPSEKVFMSLSVQTYNGYTMPYYGSSYYRHPGSIWYLE